MTNFLDLPRELRDQIYELCLLYPEPLDPWRKHGLQHVPNLWQFRSNKPVYGQYHELAFGLFRSNKTVHVEACSLLYSKNRFDFTSATAEEVASFLNAIGRNAGYISHVIIDFPEFLYLDPGDIALMPQDIDIFTSLQRGCATLRTLTTSLDSTSSVEIRLDALDHHKVATEALKLVDTHFRSISSLQDIVVELYEGSGNYHIRREMERLGWTISTTEEEEEEEDWESRRSWDDHDEYGYDDYYSDGGDDDYDIDKDSDFWRRAAD